MGRAAALFAGYGGTDTTAPVLSSAQSTSQTGTTAALSVATDTANGTMWWVVVAAADSAPSAAQIRAGHNVAGTAAVSTNGPGGTTVTTSPFTASATGLTGSTSYKVHFTQDDLSSNHSSVASSSSFSTSGSLDSDTTAWVNQVVSNGGTVSATSQGFVDTLIKAIKANTTLCPTGGLNETIDQMWLLANFDTTGSSTTTDAQALTSIVNPTAATALATPHGTWTSNTLGWQATGNPGAAAYIDTGYNPTTFNGSSAKYTLNSAAFGAYVLTTRSASDAMIAMGSYDGTHIDQLLVFPLSGSVNGINDGAGTSTPIGHNGLMTIMRSASTVLNVNSTTSGGAVTQLGGVTSTAVANLKLFAFARNDSATPTNFETVKVGLIFAGGRSGTNAAYQAALFTPIQAYMTSLGIAV